MAFYALVVSKKTSYYDHRPDVYAYGGRTGEGFETETHAKRSVAAHLRRQHLGATYTIHESDSRQDLADYAKTLRTDLRNKFEQEQSK